MTLTIHLDAQRRVYQFRESQIPDVARALAESMGELRQFARVLVLATHGNVTSIVYNRKD